MVRDMGTRFNRCGEGEQGRSGLASPAYYLTAVGILLLLLGMLAAASGAVKLRGHARTGLGRPPLARAEIAFGALLILGSGIGLARARPLAWAGVALTGAAVLISSVLHLRKWVRHWRRRRDSEGSRLEEYLELPR